MFANRRTATFHIPKVLLLYTMPQCTFCHKVLPTASGLRKHQSNDIHCRRSWDEYMRNARNKITTQSGSTPLIRQVFGLHRLELQPPPLPNSAPPANFDNDIVMEDDTSQQMDVDEAP